VRLRPELKGGETFAADTAVESSVDAGTLTDDNALFDTWMDNRAEQPPQALLEEIVNTINDRFLGLEALGLASLTERPGKTVALLGLPTIPGLAETPEAKLGVARAWIRCWQRPGVWFAGMPHGWWGNMVTGHSGRFTKTMDRLLADRTQRKVFADTGSRSFADSSPTLARARRVCSLRSCPWQLAMTGCVAQLVSLCTDRSWDSHTA
jgi:hypothetical protein